MKTAKPLRHNREFQKVYARGKSMAHPLLVTYVMAHRGAGLRYGITTSKKVGGAVQRNRARRVVKAAFQSLLPELSGGATVVFVCRTRTALCKMQDVRAAMRKALRSAELLPAGETTPAAPSAMPADPPAEGTARA